MKILHFAKVENRRVVHFDPNKWNKQLIGLEGEIVQITIEKKKKQSTPAQRKYYWPVIVTLIDDFINGHSTVAGREEVHAMLKGMFLQREREILGVVIKYTASTEKLTTVQRENYHFECRNWAQSFLGLSIPLPNETETEEWQK